MRADVPVPDPSLAMYLFGETTAFSAVTEVFRAMGSNMPPHSDQFELYRDRITQTCGPATSVSFGNRYAEGLTRKLRGIATPEERAALQGTRALLAWLALTSDWRGDEASASGGEWVELWTKLLQVVATSCPWLMFDEPLHVPDTVLRLLDTTKFGDVARQLCCPLACVLLALASAPRGVHIAVARAHLDAVTSALAAFVHKHPHMTSAVAKTHGRVWLDVCREFMPERTSIGTMEWFGKGVPVPAAQDMLAALPRLWRVHRMYARRMHAACSQCGRVPFLDQQESASPLRFCNGVCARAEAKDDSGGDGGGGGGGQRRCRDGFCGTVCQRLHWKKSGESGKRCSRAGPLTVK